MSKPVVKIYGLPRTGTNFLGVMIERNFGAQIAGSRKSGWKHGTYVDTGIPCVGLVKNPYSWLVSLWKWRTLANPITFKAWLKKSSDPCHWGLMLNHWLDAGVQFVRFEDLIVNPDKSMEVVEAAIGLQRKGNALRVPKGYVNKSRREEKEKFNAEYYLNGEYMKRYNDEALRCFGERIDVDMMARFGYKYIDKPEVEKMLVWKGLRKEH